MTILWAALEQLRTAQAQRAAMTPEDREAELARLDAKAQGYTPRGSAVHRGSRAQQWRRDTSADYTGHSHERF